jgi:hypothetical protein
MRIIGIIFSELGALMALVLSLSVSASISTVAARNRNRKQPKAYAYPRKVEASLFNLERMQLTMQAALCLFHTPFYRSRL